MTFTWGFDRSEHNLRTVEWKPVELRFAPVHGWAAARPNEDLRMIVYHRTTLEDAEAISIRGFEDFDNGEGIEATPRKGVWLADCPARVKGRVMDDVVLRLGIPEQLLVGYFQERVGDCRLFLVPAAVVNSYTPVQPCDDRGWPIDFRRAASDALRARYRRIVADIPPAAEDGRVAHDPGLDEIERQLRRYDLQFA